MSFLPHTLSSLISDALLIFFLLLLSKILYTVIFRPLILIIHYKKQGIPTYFFPMLGMVKRDRKSQRLTNDYFGYYKLLSKTDPNIRATVVNVGSRVDLHLLDPLLAKELYSHPAYYRKNLAFKLIPALLGTGLFLAEGDFWKAHRKVISSIFHFEFLRENVPMVVNTTREMLDELTHKPSQTIDLMSEMQKITGEIVGRIFFSENLGHYQLKGQQFTLYLASLASRVGILFKDPIFLVLFITGLNPMWSPTYRGFIKEINEFRSYCMEIVRDRKNSEIKKKDMLGLLLETQKASNEEDRFTDEDIANEFITFFFAGMDTIAHLMNIVIYLLDRNRDILEKVEKEVEEVYKKTEPVTMDMLNKMEISHSVLKETLRMYNPSSTIFPRIAQFDHNIGDIKVKKGTAVKTVPVYNCFSSKYFDEPDKFLPLRWLKKKESELEPYVYVPFSAGPRNCIGQHLAVISSKVMLAEFVKRFRFRTEPENFELKMVFTSLYEPKEKIRMHIECKK